MFSFLKTRNQILGMNARNLEYIRPYNKLQAIKLVDNKLRLKAKVRKLSLPVPDTYGIVRSPEELEQFNWESLPSSFVLKPNLGFGGEGILLTFGEVKRTNLESPRVWIKADKTKITINDLKNHITNILDGGFSRTNFPDIAFFEERVKILKLFKPLSYQGIPDIRILVFNKVPVMAMIRIPTRESGGRANLHMGGIGVGIDIASGVTTSAIIQNKSMTRIRYIEYVPNTRLLLSGIKIPEWKKILEIAIEAQIASGLGFAGIDIAIDREKGPMIFEINARPGLAIQSANQAPLKQRLERVKGLQIKSKERALKVAQNLFGGEVEEEIEEISGRQVVGINEQVTVFDEEQNKYQIMAKVDTGADRTAIDKEIADKLGISDKTIRYKKVKAALGYEERPIVPLTFILSGILITTEVFTTDRKDMRYNMIIGRKDLQKFLVDPTKNIFATEQDVLQFKKMEIL